MATVVAKTGIKREKGWLYYLDKKGDVSRARMARGGGKVPRGKKNEKVAVFEAYGLTAEGGGVALLDGLLNKKGLLGKRETTEVRAAAALSGSGPAPLPARPAPPFFRPPAACPARSRC